ncbi:hypothetical protein O181_022129 [Austropuccinia psidii MF-1]|uniref:Holocytochrome c-type synthase n=1 Tax=Austropuccinia psidii MF-1 TaxID=1389203 RepID=A0A9Q3CC16_9BASI|nr:hypothetical protein [Austropuccinia psidii MF-1]
MGTSQSVQKDDGLSKKNQCPAHSASIDALAAQSDDIDERNRMPRLAQVPAVGQRMTLPLERTKSSIPRTDLSSSSHQAVPSSCPMVNNSNDSKSKVKETWTYPSPQQFYNALVRKGWDTPEESVPIMVDIHNWMNEAVWQEVLKWENRYFNPINSFSSPTETQVTPEISLAKFQGRPNDLSPKARFHLLLGRLFPSTYSGQKPFDRHDWLIRRESFGTVEQDKLHRYVIDYYTDADDEDGNPVFYFDVRPAIDDLDSLSVRLREWSRIKREVWFSNDPQTVNKTSNISK